MTIILILAGLGFFFLAYLFIAGCTKSNYHFWAGRCEHCKHFECEIYKSREIFCNKHGWRITDEMETCGDYNKRSIK